MWDGGEERKCGVTRCPRVVATRWGVGGGLDDQGHDKLSSGSWR